jgi:hypothetical protein
MTVKDLILEKIEKIELVSMNWAEKSKNSQKSFIKAGDLNTIKSPLDTLGAERHERMLSEGIYTHCRYTDVSRYCKNKFKGVDRWIKK